VTTSFFGPPDFRTKDDYDKRRPKKNPEVVVLIEPKSKRRKKQMPEQRFLVPCSFTGCTARLKAGNVTHYKKVHGIKKPSPIERSVSVTPNIYDPAPQVVQNREMKSTAVSLAKEVERYLPGIIMQLARDAGFNVQRPHDEITPDTAATIRGYFKRLSR
jgi:hypothetical protein